MALNALIFDLDGTMADTEEAHRQAFNAAFLEHSLFWDWDRPKYTELMKISGGHERLAAYVETLRLSEDEHTRLREMVGSIHRTKSRIYNELITEGKVPLRQGIARLLREARAAGKQLAIVATTAAANVTPLITNALGADAYYWFKAIVSAEHVAHKKPAPDLYRLVLVGLALSAEECVAFEDSASGVKAAKAACLFTIVTPTLWTRRQDLAGADLFLYDLGEPDSPFDLRSSSIVGAPCLGLAQLEKLHAAAMERAAVTMG